VGALVGAGACSAVDQLRAAQTVGGAVASVVAIGIGRTRFGAAIGGAAVVLTARLHGGRCALPLSVTSGGRLEALRTDRARARRRGADLRRAEEPTGARAIASPVVPAHLGRARRAIARSMGIEARARQTADTVLPAGENR